jgi:integrase
VTARSPLPLHPHQPGQRQHQPARVTRDRLELLTALINAPDFDPLFRSDVIEVPPHHAVYGWTCVVRGCQRHRADRYDFCHPHKRQWRVARDAGMGRAEFVRTAEPLKPWTKSGVERSCRICPDRPATAVNLRLCERHNNRWYRYQQAHGPEADLDRWSAEQRPLPGYGPCQVRVCPDRADTPLGLCIRHRARYRSMGSPGGASLPAGWGNQELSGLPVAVTFEDETAFRQWCAATGPTQRLGLLNLRGLRPLLAAEVKWGLFRHTQRQQHTRWELDWVQNMVNSCRQRDLGSLTELESDECVHLTRLILREVRNELRLVYFTPEETRDAGFIETEHFGVLLPNRLSHFDLTGVSQRWLRDLLWDHLAETLRSSKRPRSGGTFDALRRAFVELSAFLELDAPGGGHDPATLREEHMRRFVADQLHRERHGLPALGVKRHDGTPSVVSEVARRNVFNSTRRLLRAALDSGEHQRLGLDRAFITAMPAAGPERKRARSPFPDDVARALGDDANLRQLAETCDPLDHGVRDIWEAIILTGRRCGEILNLRLDCIGRYGGLAMLWHDQTKVGRYDQAIRIPERLYELLQERQRKTLARFEGRHGRPPTPPERARLALFPSRVRNPNGQRAVSYKWFHSRFKHWVDQLDLGRCVPHQARHTLATNLLRHGATLPHIRRYLGQVSERMANHYVHVAHSDLEDVLNHVWVAGPGTANPGELLSHATTDRTTPMTREQALALAVDLGRRSTPAEGGFCTFQPVVDGGACPWNLNCHNCDKFVLSGADLLYWRRKREQWASIAERAPDDATADYLHQVFEPTARAIDGLEKALAGLGLLDDALAMDLRRPQDYFHRLWSLTFPAAKLTATDSVDVDLGEPQDAPA